MNREDKIKEAAAMYAADKCGEKDHKHPTLDALNRRRTSEDFLAGAKSQAARQYHNEWISVRDRLPNIYNKNVLGLTNRKRHLITYRVLNEDRLDEEALDCHYEGCDEHFTHWQPLPPAPKD